MVCIYPSMLSIIINFTHLILSCLFKITFLFSSISFEERVKTWSKVQWFIFINFWILKPKLLTFTVNVGWDFFSRVKGVFFVCHWIQIHNATIHWASFCVFKPYNDFTLIKFLELILFQMLIFILLILVDGHYLSYDYALWLDSANVTSS